MDSGGDTGSDMPDGVQESAVPATEERLQAYRHIVLPIWVYDIDNGRVHWANPPALKLWQADTLQELRSRNLAREMSPTVAKRLLQFKADIETGGTFSEQWTLYPNGSPETLTCTFSGIRLDDGRMAMFCQGSQPDASTPDSLRSAQALLHTSVMISTYGPDGVRIYDNPAARSSKSRQTKTLEEEFVHASDYQSIMSSIAHTGTARLVAEMRTEHGTRWHEINAHRGIDPVTGEQTVHISETDVSALKETEQTATFLALHDVLTGLPNRTYLQQVFEKKVLAADAFGDKLGLLFIDLDHFKNVNDSLGHAVGDKLLLEVAERLGNCTRNSDITVRLGGDEFVVLLEDTASLGSVDRAARRIQDALNQPIVIDEHELRISPSIGISIYPDEGGTLSELMQNADLALYEAKARGRNQFCYFSKGLRVAAESRMQMESDLRRAIGAGELELLYQPQVCFRRNQVMGAEALLRWNHPHRGQIGPDEFIAVAEESGLIEQIGFWVLQTAAVQQMTWNDAGYPINVSVNLSPRQFHSKALLPAIAEIAATNGFDPSRFDLEITESMLMGDNDRAIDALRRIDEMGFNLAIDDFGTGYSNLVYLQKYPIRCLKIDRSFIADLNKTSAIAELIISMCKLLDVKIIAEGVENETQLGWLKERGCHAYQGFVFSRPISAVAFESSFLTPGTFTEESGGDSSRRQFSASA